MSNVNEGQFILQRFNGDEIYRVATAVLWAHAKASGGLMLWCEVTTEPQALQTLPDTAEMEMHPYAELGVALPNLDVTQLAGTHFQVPSAYDAQAQERVATLYYCEHQDLDDNELRILARDGERFQIHWTATTGDVNHYDGSQPRTRVEITSWCKFQEMEKWLPADER
jgi:hypothetical protein